MDNQQVLSILAVVVTAYPTVELTDEMATLWEQMLSDVTFESAQRSLKQHIKTSKWPPTIADIRANTSTANDILRIETQQCFALIDSWERGVVPLLKDGETND
ncbi:replicative helicase loader/inhibitor [Paenibacillus tundrae]|uniref:replicative helicase loader/inhibitor n=1 Tax=Paenibacillus tundrae TaxID=528187 RepID=UPI003520CE1D